LCSHKGNKKAKFARKQSFIFIFMSFINKGKVLVVLSMLAVAPACMAQKSLDKIIGIIGRNRIILQSELEAQIIQSAMQEPGLDTSKARCALLQQMIAQKMMMEQADRDSVTVSEDDVEGQLDNRLRYFTQVYGSKEKLEQVSGKTIFQLKEDYRDLIKEQLLAQKVTEKIFENTKITPAEVEAFYKRIPVDSLPFFPATVEVGQIVMDPPVSQEMEDYAHSNIEDIRKKIIEGRISFEAAAGSYSEDPGSRDNGGRYDAVTRTGPWVQEFINATFKLQNGEISPIIKTKFGYHIIQMISRRGDEADIRHILIKPTVTTADFNKTISKLDSVYKLLAGGKMSFSEAVGKFSTDEGAKRTGGMVIDPQTGSSDLDITKLDPVMVLLLDTLKPGGFSSPHVFVNEQREKSCRIVYLRTRTTPHKANLKEDYGKIQSVALEQKKQNKVQGWVTTKVPTFYLWIAPEYRDCDGMRDWVQASEKQ
jgi:peptidyl-prolyl cis-trans isomerase SurA